MLTVVYVVAAALAIGLLIFFHELGHYWVAKKVGIRVEAFSIGFGPKLFGFKRGEEDWKVCAIPLGGYVKMAGESPGEGRGDPDDFGSKTVGQRAWVVSAGVIANVLLALVLFPLAFTIGVPMPAPVIGSVVPGGAAWEAGLRSGDRIKEVGGETIFSFDDVRMGVAFRGDPLDFRLERGDAEIVRTVTPRWDADRGLHSIGITPWVEPELFVVEPAALDHKLSAGERVVGAGGVRFTENLERLQRMLPRWKTDDAPTLALLVAGPESETTREVEIPQQFEALGDDAGWAVGVRFANTRVGRLAGSTRSDSAARAFGLREGETIVGVDSDPVFSLFRLREALERAPRGALVSLAVRRNDGTVESRTKTSAPEDAEDLLQDVLWETLPLVDLVETGSPAEAAGLRAGDLVVSARGRPVEASPEGTQAVITAVAESEGRPETFGILRGEERLTLEVTPAKPWNNVTLTRAGLATRDIALETVKVPFPESIVVGLRQTRDKLKNIVLTFRSLLVGDVAARNMGGVITIAAVSYTFAEQGIGRLLWFMAFMSLNLAFLNILPIPVLDGGHLLFLALEKIKGEPLSDRAMGLANIAGMALIIGLMLFVTWNDIARFFL